MRSSARKFFKKIKHFLSRYTYVSSRRAFGLRKGALNQNARDTVSRALDRKADLSDY